MLKLIIKLGKYLERRFPERVVVTRSDYDALLLRLSAVEKSAVHVEAVRDVVKAVKALKDDHDSFKASMGFTPQKGRILEAMLNGEIISGEDNTNG